MKVVKTRDIVHKQVEMCHLCHAEVIVVSLPVYGSSMISGFKICESCLRRALDLLIGTDETGTVRRDVCHEEHTTSTGGV